MGSTRQFSVTLPNGTADAVRAEVARDEAVEAWRRREVAAAFDDLKAEPGRAVGAADVRQRLAEAQRTMKA